jgi:hypothetical protein
MMMDYLLFTLAVFPKAELTRQNVEPEKISVFYLLTGRGFMTSVCTNPILEDHVRGSRRLIYTVTA